MFTDIVGSTALKQALGDAEALACIQRYRGFVRELLRVFADAEEVSTTGDSFFLVSPGLPSRCALPGGCTRDCGNWQARRALATGSRRRRH